MKPTFRAFSAMALAGALLSPLMAQAHDGHGLPGSHWHSTDVLGFVLLAVVLAAGVWWSKRK